MGGKQGLSIKERLLENSIPIPECGCLIWLGALDKSGYGKIHINKIGVLKTHRLAWEIENGPILNNSHVLHNCDTRCCINPNHLFLGTNLDNVNDKVFKNRTPFGVNHWKTNFTNQQIEEIRNSTLKTKKLAEIYKVSYGTIWQIRNNKRWLQ